MVIIILSSGNPFNLGGGGRGRVSLLGFPAFALTSGCGQIFGQGLRLHLNPLLVQLFDGFLCVEAALLHPFQRRGKGENGLLHGHGAVSVQRDGGGLEPGESCLISFSWLAVMLMVFSPVIDGGMSPDLSFAFGGQAARLPTGLRSKP